MYGNAYIENEPQADAKKTAIVEDPVKLAEFEARIDRGEKIEPDDWMPTEYRRQVLRMIEQHAHSEIIGALPEGTWITRAPSLRRKLALIAKVQDEVGHGHLLYAAAETLGKTREAMINDLINGKSKYSNIFNYPAKTWADIPVIGFLVDAGAIVNQLANAKGSYGPYCRALERICYEESFHLKQGYDGFVALAAGTPMQRAMVQDALNRWWFPPLMHFFGPPDTISVHTEKLMKWKVKMATNEEMRQDFMEQYVPKIWELGMTLPDPALKRNDDGSWNYTQPDWDEFFRVINGDGPCNKERLAVRRYTEESGRWVREALMNPTRKHVVPYA